MAIQIYVAAQTAMSAAIVRPTLQHTISTPEYTLPEETREQSHDFSQNDCATTTGVPQVHVGVHSDVTGCCILRNATHDGWSAKRAT